MSILVLQGRTLLPRHVCRVNERYFIITLLMSCINRSLHRYFNIIRLCRVLIFFRQFFRLVMLISSFHHMINMNFFIRGTLSKRPIKLYKYFIQPTSNRHYRKRSRLQRPRRLCGKTKIVSNYTRRAYSSTFYLNRIHGDLTVRRNINNNIRRQGRIIMTQHSLSIFHPRNYSIRVNTRNRRYNNILRRQLIRIYKYRSTFRFTISYGRSKMGLRISRHKDALHLTRRFPWRYVKRLSTKMFPSTSSI